MSRRPQTDIAILGGLSVEPMTGYALRAAITETLGHFWSESFGQIYPALARLEAAGLVRRANPGQTSGSQFELTPTGLAHLKVLLAEPAEATPPRNPLLLRLFFGRLLGVEVCRDLIADVRAKAVASLHTYTAIRAEVASDPNENARYWLITIAAGEHTARAQIAWADEALQLLAEVAPTTAI